MFEIKQPVKKAIVLALSLFFVIACSEQPKPHFKLSGSTMGTGYNLTVLVPEQVVIDQHELQAAIDQQLALINQQMSTYIADSELLEFNRAATSDWITVSPNLFDVLIVSMELAWVTDGSFDFTIGPLVELWGFGPGGLQASHSIPDPAAIERALAMVAYQNLELDLESSQIRKKKPLALDLSAIAKGFAVDKLTELLSYAGYTDFMVEIGGELSLRGLNPMGNPWRIAIERPQVDRLLEPFSAVSLSNKSMATSGDYRNYFEQDGKRFSHTIDPRTGYPIEHKLASVTVIADSAAYADGLATAINVLGPDKGMALAEQQQLAVYMLVRQDDSFVVLASEAFKPFLVELE